MCTWHCNAKGFSSPDQEKCAQIFSVLSIQHSEARQRRTDIATQSWRDAPYPATSGSQLHLLFGRIFFQAIRGISDNCLKASLRLFVQPLQTIVKIQLIGHNSSPTKHYS